MSPLDPELRPYPRYAAIARATLRLIDEAAPWQGTLFRSAEPTYAAREDRLDGVGGALHGGRWNPLGLACVYGSMTPEGAMAETLANQRHYGLPAEAVMPRTFFAFEGVVGRALDLTDGDIRKRLGVTLRDLLACDWRGDRDAGREALTQAVGRAAVEAGMAALVVPSAVLSDGINVALFPPAFTGDDVLRALRADQLRPQSG